VKNELKAKDDEYVKALKRQAEDIENLLTWMGAQFHELQDAFEEELKEIEQSFFQVT
jgi:dynein regulatory complex protein 1